MSEEVKQEGEFKIKSKAPKIKGQGNVQKLQKLI